MPVEVKRARSRVYERLDWLHAWHCLTGPEYLRGTDSHFGVLVNHDHGIVSAGTGFDTHYHRNMEIVTWVLDGSLVHQDTRGHSGLIHPGLAQRMTAGAGILHSERNDSWVLDGPRHERDVEMVQMWVARGRRRDPDPEPVRHPVGRATAARGVRAPARRAVGAPVRPAWVGRRRGRGPAVHR